MSVLVVIPARGGSVGVNRKAMQLVGGEPLVVRAARIASGLQAKVVVSTEDPEIRSLCLLRGIAVLQRPEELAAPIMPLSGTIRHAAEAFPQHDTVLVLQPTVPLVTTQDLKELLDGFRASSLSAAYAVVADPHQFWKAGSRLTPHVNRQALEQDYDRCLYRETGIRVMTRAHALTGQGTTGVVELDSPALGLDIDTYADLNQAEAQLSRKRVSIRCIADPRTGTGHLFRCLRLADALRRSHDVDLDVLDISGGWIDKLLLSRNLLHRKSDARAPDLLILDALDQYDSQIIGALQYGTPTVVLENDSPTALRHATLVINELLPQSIIPQSPNVLAGPSYAVLREEFVALPHREYNPCLKKVVVSFGGSDPANLAQRAANLQVLRDPDIEVRVIQGPAALQTPKVRENTRLIYEAHMAEEFYGADLVITSQGRTQYEAAACGAPIITIAANEREARHARVPGALHLGLHAQVTGAALNEAVARTVSTRGLREEMGTTAKQAVDGRGVERICWAVDGILRGL